VLHLQETLEVTGAEVLVLLELVLDLEVVTMVVVMVVTVMMLNLYLAQLNLGIYLLQVDKMVFLLEAVLEAPLHLILQVLEEMAE
jgi:hypothetical protein